MKVWDVIIVGAGIIGVSLAIELRKRGCTVLIVERGEPGREASHAAGGMLVDCPVETQPALQALATASARMYPEFAHELEIESGASVDLRDQGTIFFPSGEHPSHSQFKTGEFFPTHADESEPALSKTLPHRDAFYLKERSVDPQALTAAAIKTAKRRGIDFSSGDPVTAIRLDKGCVRGVTTTRTEFHAAKVVNCAGAWAGQISPCPLPTRPVKGQMLCLVSPRRELLRHVIRAPEVYLIPRSDGRILAGATVEEAGFDKRTDAATMQRLHRAAVALVPELQKAKILEGWAGLRPGSPDALPILGASDTPGYYAAAGHFRDGILLAPITAQVMAAVITGVDPGHDLTAFRVTRFSVLNPPS